MKTQPSNSQAPRPAWGRKTIAEASALALMLLGIIMVCQPFIQILFRYGFLVTIAGIIAFMFASHMQDAAS